MKPKVSVIVPVCRAEEYLKRCVDSLLNQTLAELQVILVDDGSPDICPALCEAFAQQDHRILALHKENEGAGPARNAGLAAAQGEYIGFLDADDYALPEMYQRLYEAACAHDADMVLSGTRYLGGVVFGSTGAEEVKYCFEREQVFYGDSGMRRLALGTAGALPHEREDSRYGFSSGKNIYRRSLLEERGIRFLPEREVGSEDALFLLDVIPCCRKAVGIPGAWYCYCWNGASVSKGYREGRFSQAKRLIAEMEKRLSRIAQEAEYRPYLDRQLQACARVASVQEIVHARDAALTGRGTRERLRAISGDPGLAAALRRLPWWRLPPAQAAFAFAMRYRLTGLQRLLVALREKR